MCDYFAYLGANLICLDRNIDKSNKLIANLKAKYPSLNAKHITIDLENFDMVKNAVEHLKTLESKYKILYQKLHVYDIKKDEIISLEKSLIK